MIKTEKPFSAYVLVHEFPKTREARDFELVLAYRFEGSKQTQHLHWRWSYADTEAAIKGEYGLKAIREQAIAAFRQITERELKATGEKLYSVLGEALPVRGRGLAR